MSWKKRLKEINIEIGHRLTIIQCLRLNKKDLRHEIKTHNDAVDQLKEERRKLIFGTFKDNEWKYSEWVCPHQYKHRAADPALAKEIETSKTTEVYNNKTVPIIFREDFKYWLTGDFINRKPQTPEEKQNEP